MKFNENRSYLKVISPYVYSLNELADILRVSYNDVKRRRKSGEFVAICGRSGPNYRFSYFMLPKWVQEVLPVPSVIMPQVKRYKFKK